MHGLLLKSLGGLALFLLLLSCVSSTPGLSGAITKRPARDDNDHRAARPARNDRQRLQNTAIALPQQARPAAPEKPKPLGPLRTFTRDEWRRIRGVQRFVDHAARRYKLSPSLINGMIWVESKFERRARGVRGPRGLMQLMPRTARAMAKELRRRYMPNSADFNISVGTYYLTRMLDQFKGDLHLALAAYNRGPAHIRAWQEEGAPLPKPRMPYVSRVMRAAREFCVRLKKRREPKSGPFVCSRDSILNDVQEGQGLVASAP